MFFNFFIVMMKIIQDPHQLLLVDHYQLQKGKVVEKVEINNLLKLELEMLVDKLVLKAIRYVCWAIFQKGSKSNLEKYIYQQLWFELHTRQLK